MSFRPNFNDRPHHKFKFEDQMHPPFISLVLRIIARGGNSRENGRKELQEVHGSSGDE